jgi:hypothetical protein
MRIVLWYLKLARDSGLRGFQNQVRWSGTYFVVGFFLLLFTSPFESTSQTYLSVRNQHRPVRVNYELGDNIALKLDGDSPIYRGEINALNDTSLVLGDVRIPLHRIDVVLDYDSRASLRTLLNSAFLAIPIFLVYTGMHRWINTGERPILEKNAVVLSGIYGGMGLALRPFGVKRYRVGNRWDLKVVDTSFY